MKRNGIRILLLLCLILCQGRMVYAEAEKKGVFDLYCAKDGNVENAFSAVKVTDPETGAVYLVTCDLAAAYQNSGYALYLTQGDFQKEVTAVGVQSGLSFLSTDAIGAYPAFTVDRTNGIDLSAAKVAYYNEGELYVYDTDLSGWNEGDSGWYESGREPDYFWLLGCPVINEESGSVIGVLSTKEADDMLLMGMMDLRQAGLRTEWALEGGGENSGASEEGGDSGGGSGADTGDPDEKISVLPEIPAWVWIAAIVVCGGIVWSRQKGRQDKKENRAGSGEMQPAVRKETGESPAVRLVEDSVQAPEYYITGIEGIQKGKIYEIHGVCWIGRSRDCQIRYPEDTGGISRYHCQVVLDSGKLLLMDVGSAYGTYLGDGRQLEKNVPQELRDGDSFYLAERRQMFRVSLKK